MTGTMTKRQQARNEKALQELVNTTSGNNTCADCSSLNPAWASWSLGIFLCMRCAAIHRKLGTHISKVKSLSMDSWTNEQVDNMRKVGNITSNKLYNPQGKKPPIPIDVDEADSAMERFIRKKYVGSGLKTNKRNSRGSTISEEGTPPPLPPKNPSKFSSILSLGGRKKDKTSAPPSRDGALSPRPSPRSVPSPRNKPSKVFGASLDYGVGDEVERKMAKLRDMGFIDEQRNALVLKGMHGNMEKTVESLIRLGEGGRSSSSRESSSLSTTTAATTAATSRSLTPITNGLSLAPSSGAQRPTSLTYNNPFDNIQPPAQPQSSQSTGTTPSTNNPFFQSQQLQQPQQSQLAASNPFGVPVPRQHSDAGINQAFQNMSLAPTQSLFPHHTGGAPGPQAANQPYQQSMTPPVQASQNYGAVNFNSNMSYPPPTQQVQQVQPQPTGYNPFLQPQSSQSSPGLALNTNGIQGQYGSNPFARSPTRIQSPSILTQIPESTQQNVYYTPQAAQSPSTNPFFANSTPAAMQAPQAYAQQSQQVQQFQLQQPQQQQQIYQQPQRADNATIMALFNYPQLAPQPMAQQQPTEQTSGGDMLGLGGNQQQQQQADARPTGNRSVSAPLISGSKNPFGQVGSAAATTAMMTPRSEEQPANGGNHKVSRESMNLGMDMAWSNGRHSPDAFASLSARQ